MGWLSGLGKIAGGIAGIAAAPFTGGASLAATLPGLIGGGAGILSGLGDVTSRAAAGSTGQRLAEAQPQLQAQQLRQQAARDQFQGDLQSRQFSVSEDERIKRNQVLRALLGGMQDFNAVPGNPAIAARMGQSTGGARPSALTANKEALMKLLESPTGYQAPSFTPAPSFDVPQAGGFEKALGGIGLGSNILGLIGNYLPRPQATPPYVPPDVHRGLN